MRTSLRLLTPAIAPLVLLADTTVLAAQDTASGRGIGVVTALQGQATVSRATLPQPAPLRFKENVFFRDRITTKERSTLRLLLGGKGVLTIREQSQVTLDEQVAGPAPQSVISLAAGKVGAAIARSLMRPGETVEIRTPNASAAVRGTVLIAEYLPPTQNAAAPERLLLASAGGAWPILAQAGGAGQSNFFVLSGQVTVSVAGQPPVTLGAMQSVSVTATPAGVAVGGVQAMTPEQAAQASQGLQAGKAPAGAAEAGRGAQAQAQIAAALATAIVEASQAGQPTAPPGGASADSAPSQGGDSTTEQATETPITPDVSTATTENTPPAGSLVEISETAVGLAAGVPLADIADGAVNSVAAMAISGTGTLARTTPLLSLRGKTITHSGRLAGLAAGAALAGAAADFETALLRVDGNSLTNTDAELLRLRGGSSVTTYGPLLGLKTGATATLAGLLDASENSWVELRLAEGVRVPTGTTLKADQPLFRLTEGDALHDADGNLLPVLKTAGALLGVSGGKVELSGPGQVLQAVDSKVHLGGSLLRIAGTGATLTGTATAPMVFVENHPLTVAGSLLDLREGATVTTSGIVLDAKESDVIVTGPLFAIRGASRLELSGGPLVRLRGGSLTGTGGFGDSDEVGNHITATGAMLDATDATITFSRTTATDIPAAGASTEVLAFDMPAGASQVTLTNTDYTDTTEDEVGMLPSGTATFHGRLLLATDSRLDLGGKLFQVDGATDKVTTTETEPLIRLRGTEVTTGRPAVRVSKGELTTSGPLLRAEVSDAGTASTITSVSGHSILAVEAGGKLSGTAGTSLLQLTNTTVEPGAYVADVQGAGSTLGLAGPLAALEAGGSVTAENGFLRLWNGGSLSGTGTTPLVTSSAADFTGGDGANTGGSFLWMGSGPGQTETKLDLRGGLLSDTASTLETTDGDFLAVRDGATLTTASTGAALVTLNGSTVKAPKTLFRFGPESSSAAAAGSGEITTVSLSGPLVDATNTAFSTTGGGFLGVLDKTSFTGTGTEPLISLKKAGTSWSTVDTPAGHVLFLEAPSGTTPPTLTLNGPLLKAVGAVITSGDTTGTPPANANSVLRVTGSAELTGKGSGALVQLSEGASVTAAGDFLTIRSSQTGTNSLVDLTGPLAGLDDATFTSTATGPACCSFLMLAESGKLTGRGSEALITLASSSEVTTNGPFLKLAGSSRLGLAGPLLSATASDVTADGDAFMDVSNSEITATGGTEPFISLSGGGLTLASPVAMFRVRDGGTVSVPGSLFKASNTTFTFTTLAPVLSLVDGSLTEGSRLLDLQTSTLDLGTQPLVKMASGSTLTTIGAGPIIHVTGGSLAAAALISTDGAANTLKLAGTLLEAREDAAVTLGAMISAPAASTDSLSYTATDGVPLVKLVDSDLTITGSDVALVAPGLFGTKFGGLSLDARNGTLNEKTLKLEGPVLRLKDVALSSTETQVRIENMTLETSDSTVKVEAGTSATSGPLLDATNGSITVTENLLELEGSAVLNTDTHTDPLFSVKGVDANLDASTGLGTREVLKTTGATIEVDGATVKMKETAKGNLFSLDKALLHASAPIVNLLNNAYVEVNGNSSDASRGAIHVNQSTLSTVADLKLFSLDKSTLQVNHGPLLSVTGGTQMTVEGDFAYLTNGSRITVQNGPLIYVAGQSPKGVASALTVNGPFIHFGSGDNKVLITNGIEVTRSSDYAYVNGVPVTIPVHESKGGSVSVGFDAIKQSGTGSNTFSVTGTGGANTGAAIQATDNGKVIINRYSTR